MQVMVVFLRFGIVTVFLVEAMGAVCCADEFVSVGVGVGEEPPLTLKLAMYPPLVLENPEVSVNAETITVQPPVKVVAGIDTVT